MMKILGYFLQSLPHIRSLNSLSLIHILTGNMQEVTQNIEGSVKISAFVAYDHEEQSQLDMIQATIKNLEHVVSVEYSSKDQEFDELMKTYEAVSYTHL